MNLINNIYWWCRVVFLSLRWITRFNLGDSVIYQGKEWILVQGVNSPYWDLRRDTEKVSAHEDDFHKAKALRNYLHSFRAGYRFYMGYWYSIWVREGIKPWMRGCKIW